MRQKNACNHFPALKELIASYGMNLTEADDVKKRWQEYTEIQKRSSWPR